LFVRVGLLPLARSSRGESPFAPLQENNDGPICRVRPSEGPACQVRCAMKRNPSRFDGHDKRAPPMVQPLPGPPRTRGGRKYSPRVRGDVRGAAFRQPSGGPACQVRYTRLDDPSHCGVPLRSDHNVGWSFRSGTRENGTFVGVNRDSPRQIGGGVGVRRSDLNLVTLAAFT